MKFSSTSLFFILVSLSVTFSLSFTTISQCQPQRKSTDCLTLKASILDNISLPSIKVPNVFNDKSRLSPRPPSTPPPFEMSTPDSVLISAKSFLSSDLGIADPSALADNFVWIGPNVMSTGSLNKEEYIAAGKYFNLRGAFPDLDYRAHDFRIVDTKDSEINKNLVTVRLTARTVGTMRGKLRLRGETLEPNGKRMVCPPEAISITFNTKTGKVVKLVSGFCMDRLVGNTGGLCGVQAAATIAGAPPSEWELYPPVTVLNRFFGRSVTQIQEPDKVFISPFPETVMIQLAKGVLASDLGTKDPDLLSDAFTFCGPLVGPLDKSSFMETFANFRITDALPDLEQNYTNFRVDPYDPYRIWYDVQATGTRTGTLAGRDGNGAKYKGPPEAASMTFDDEGFCTRLTAGAVMDPTIGNTGGLGGIYGIFYATGIPLPAVVSRTIPEIISRAKADLLSPFLGTKVGGVVDILEADPNKEVLELPTLSVMTSSKAVSYSAPEPPQTVPPVLKITTSSKDFSIPRVSIKKTISQEKILPINRIPIEMNATAPFRSVPGQKPLSPFSSFFRLKTKTTTAESSASRKVPSWPKTFSEENSSRFLNAEAKPSTQLPSPTVFTPKPSPVIQNGTETGKKESRSILNSLERNGKQVILKNINKNKLMGKVVNKQEQKKPVLSVIKKNDENQNPTSLKLLSMRNPIQEKKKPSTTKLDVEKKLSTYSRGTTISLGIFNFGNSTNIAETSSSSVVKNLNPGVPVLSKWKRNADGSITGNVSQSASFADGESITTSQLKTKDPIGNSLVQTISGSKYFLKGDSIAKGLKTLSPEILQRSSSIMFKEKGSAEPISNSSNASSPKKGPKGVPEIRSFKKNIDGSITGFIWGSKRFEDGDKITTSKLAPGQNIESGSTVQTVTGSLYFIV